jgi:pimeloyl-ACP methyl ester carboxylesterase
MKSFFRFLGALLALLLLVAFVGIAITWAPDRQVAALAARWAPPPSVFVPVSGMAVHLRDEGRREDPLPIVLLHGTSASLHTWDGWVAALAPTRRVVRFDLPGFGLTGPFASGDYSLPSYVRFVRALLDQQGIARCVLAGNSFGGTIAWAVAAAQPERVERLILVDAGGYPLVSRAVPIGFRIARTPGLNQLSRFILPRRVIESSLRNVYGDPDKVTAALVDRYYELTLRAGNRLAVAERLRQAPAGILADEIAKVKQPTLILWGEKDRLIPPEHAALFQRDIVGSQVVMFAALGHVPHEEDPEATVAAVQAFLAGAAR